MRAVLRYILPAIGAAALPVAAAEPEAFACTVTTVCESPAPCHSSNHLLSLLIGREGALVTDQAGHQTGFDRPVTRTERGPVRSFASLTLLDTTLLLTQDREAGTLVITEHARDTDGPVVITQFATCRPEEG